MKAFGRFLIIIFGGILIMFIFSVTMMIIGGGGAPSTQKTMNWALVIGGLLIVGVIVLMIRLWKYGIPQTGKF